MQYFYDDKKFIRKVTISNQTFLDERIEDVKNAKTSYKDKNYVAKYNLKYRFQKNIQSVSNPKANIEADKKGFTLTFELFDVLENPEITNIEVVFE